MSWCTMASFGREQTGITLSVLGWMLSVISCALPMWSVSPCDHTNIAQLCWEGLWMRCVSHNTGQMQCNFHHSMLDLPQDLLVARVLTVVAIILGLVGLLILMVGAKCTNCIQNERVKAEVIFSSGGVFITAALVQLVPVLWSAFTIIVEFFSSLILYGQKRKTGAALYLGFVASAMLFIGGSNLSTCHPPQKDKHANKQTNRRTKYSTYPQTCVIYSATPRSPAQSSYDKRD